MIRLKDRQEDDARDAHCYNDQHQRRCQLQRGQGHGKNGAAIEAGNEFKLSMKEFTIGSGKDAKDYVMVVVTCKAQVKSVPDSSN